MSLTECRGCVTVEECNQEPHSPLGSLDEVSSVHESSFGIQDPINEGNRGHAFQFHFNRELVLFLLGHETHDVVLLRREVPFSDGNLGIECPARYFSRPSLALIT